MPTLLELRNQLNEARTKGIAFYESFPTKKLADGSEARDIPADKLGEIRAMQDEVNNLAEEVRTLEGVDVFKSEPTRGGESRGVPGVQNRSWAADLVAGKGKRQLETELRGPGWNVDLEARTLMTTTSGYVPQVLRDSTTIPAFSYPMGLVDYIQVVPTDQTSTIFMKQTTRTIPANPKNQGVAGDEATIAYTATTSPISTITVYIPISLEQLEDETGVQALVENDLMMACRQSLDYEITAGTGTAPSLTGILNAASKQTYAKAGADSNFDALLKGITKVATGGGSGGRGGRWAAPNLVLMNPSDLQLLQMTRTSEGMYILQNPGDTPIDRIWGVPVAKSLNITAGTAAVLDTSFMKLRLRKGARIYMTDSDGINFEKRIITLRCDLRAGFEIWSDEAICTVTSIA